MVNKHNKTKFALYSVIGLRDDIIEDQNKIKMALSIGDRIMKKTEETRICPIFTKKKIVILENKTLSILTLLLTARKQNIIGMFVKCDKI